MSTQPPHKIVFMGSDAVVLPLLEWLWEESGPVFELAAVVSQPAKPSGRGQQLKNNLVAEWALEHGVPLRTPVKPGPAEAEWLREEGVSLGLVMAYGHILRQNLLDAPRLGMLNFHASILPAYRGAAPIEAALLQGDKVTGVSLMQMTAGMDEGPVMDVVKVEIAPDDNNASLRWKLGEACPKLLARCLPKILEGRAVFHPQDASKASYTRKIEKDDGGLDFSLPAVELERRVRAFYPWPCAFFDHRNARLRVGASRVLNYEPRDAKKAPGCITLVDRRDIVVGTGDGFLELTYLQKPGGRMLDRREFLRGYSLQEGFVEFLTRPMPPLVTPEPFRIKPIGPARRIENPE